MKPLLRLLPFLSLAVLLLASCQKSANLPSTRTDDAALNANRQSIDNTLSSIDLSSQVPGDAWWTDEQNDATSSATARTIPVDASQYIKFSFLKAALMYTGLDVVLADPNTTYTLFAPSDAAFQNSGFATIDDLLAVGKDALTQILLYHVVSGKVFAADIPLAVNTPVNSLQGDTLYLTRKENPSFNHLASVNGLGVYIADVTLSTNGVAHVINKVLMYPAGNIVETAIANPDLSYLVAAVLRASTGSTDVAGVLSGAGPLTVFAPTNQAFINAGFATIDDINNADPNTLASILTYHVVAARVFSSDVKSGDMPTMLTGEMTMLTREGEKFERELKIKGNSNTTASAVQKRNIVASNGVVHVIDQVLLP